MKKTITIGPLRSARFDDFIAYLNDHLSDNGENNTPLFQPISRDDLNISNELIYSFKKGTSIPLNKLGWRRVLVALNEKEEIIGHIDLRSHNKNYTNHRATMGMGVHRDYRKAGMGRLLVESMVEWVKNETTIEQIDLWVLSNNIPAIDLYEKTGFRKLGEVEDMFRIGGKSYAYTMMTKSIL